MVRKDDLVVLSRMIPLLTIFRNLHSIRTFIIIQGYMEFHNEITIFLGIYPTYAR